jgi:hypothetical protein
MVGIVADEVNCVADVLVSGHRKIVEAIQQQP